MRVILHTLNHLNPIWTVFFFEHFHLLDSIYVWRSKQTTIFEIHPFLFVIHVHRYTTAYTIVVGVHESLYRRHIVRDSVHMGYEMEKHSVVVLYGSCVRLCVSMYGKVFESVHQCKKINLWWKSWVVILFNTNIK